MSVDLRTELNDADNVTGWAGDGATPALNTLTGQRYEGTGSIDTQHTNANEHIWTTQLSGGGGTFSIDMSARTIYLLVKDNLIDTQANGGAQITIGDGTDDIGFEIGGNDAVGLPLSPFFNCYKLDVSNRGSFTAQVYAGSAAALTVTAITRVGYGSLHLAKAQGNVANVFVDRIMHGPNNSAHLRINGGTGGTPETMADVQGDDVTNGWGMIANPVGSQYIFFAPTEWGEPTANADAFFNASNEQWFWDGTGIGAGNFDFRVIANATDTISFVLDNVVIVNVGARAAFDISDNNISTLQISGGSFTDLGPITLPSTQDAGNKFLDAVTFNNCDQANLGATDCDGLIFNGTTDANGAIIWTATTVEENQDNLRFNSDGTGHAIHISIDSASPTTFNIDGYIFDGYAGQTGTAGNRVFFIDNPSDGDITINLTNSTALNVQGGGSGFSFELAAGTTSSVTINQTVTLTVTVEDERGDPVSGARVRIEAASDGSLISQGTTNASGVYTDGSFNFTGDTAVTTKVRLKGFKFFRTGGTITASGISVGVTLQDDDIVDLP